MENMSNGRGKLVFFYNKRYARAGIGFNFLTFCASIYGEYIRKRGHYAPHQSPHKGNKEKLWQKAHFLRLTVQCILSSNLNVPLFGAPIAAWNMAMLSETSVTPFPSTIGSVRLTTRR